MKGLNTSLAEHVSQVEVILLNYMTEEEGKKTCLRIVSNFPAESQGEIIQTMILLLNGRGECRLFFLF